MLKSELQNKRITEKVNCNMLVFLLAAFLLSLVLCSDSSKPSSPHEEDRLQLQLHNTKFTTTYLKPRELKSKKGLPDGLLPYGFIINTNEVIIPKKIIVKAQTLSIPKTAKALLITIPKSKGKRFSQDIQISPLPYTGLQQFEFHNVKLKEDHIPIFLQYVDTPVVKRGKNAKLGSEHHSSSKTTSSKHLTPQALLKTWRKRLKIV